MATIDDVRLPIDVERGAKGGPGFLTSIVTMQSGAEQRNQEWVISRGQWDIGYGIRRRADLQAVINFFYGRRGRARAFRFRDWLDFELTAEPAQSIDASHFQIIKTYADTENPYVRNIVLPVGSTLIVYVDNLALDPVDYALQPNGIIEFEDAPGGNVKITCEFDVPARFDIDQLPVTLNTYTEGDISSIPIIELK